MAATARQRISECVAGMHSDGLIQTSDQKEGLIQFFEEELRKVGEPAPNWYFDIEIDEVSRAKLVVEPYAHSIAAWEAVVAGTIGTQLSWPDGRCIEVVGSNNKDVDVMFTFQNEVCIVVPHAKIADGLNTTIKYAVQRGARFAET